MVSKENIKVVDKTVQKEAIDDKLDLYKRIQKIVIVAIITAVFCIIACDICFQFIPQHYLFGEYHEVCCKNDNTRFVSSKCRICSSSVSETGVFRPRLDINSDIWFSSQFNSYAEYAGVRNVVMVLSVFAFLSGAVVAICLVIYLENRKKIKEMT